MRGPTRSPTTAKGIPLSYTAFPKLYLYPDAPSARKRAAVPTAKPAVTHSAEPSNTFAPRRRTVFPTDAMCWESSTCRSITRPGYVFPPLALELPLGLSASENRSETWLGTEGICRFGQADPLPDKIIEVLLRIGLRWLHTATQAGKLDRNPEGFLTGNATVVAERRLEAGLRAKPHGQGCRTVGSLAASREPGASILSLTIWSGTDAEARCKVLA